MPLPNGHRIGNYEILGPAGAGGRGEVYRARDTRLDRTVAVKALPAGVSENPQRLARFEREARLLASLNHANIASIYGIEDGAEGGPYLVLEFVDGPTLSQKLAQGPLTLSDTIRIGSQIAAAVEAAHERGIVHRDLKPGNVMLTASGAVKVLDFGLAKEDGPVDDSAPDLSASPTMTNPATGEGVVLGTAPYMSPEQARGRPADKRVDVWAFGCILMECLTGKQVFPGDTPSDVIARILEREPDWDQLPPGTPPRLQDILRRCLTKETGQRPRDIGDLGRELRSLFSDSSSGSGMFRAAADETPSVAVLYFDNLARDPDSEYFCAGITEDILTDLSKINGLRVASKNAVSRYRGKEVDLKRVALDLGVQAVLEGSVRRAGERIRITVQLINAGDGFQLWGERFDRTLDDVFAVQDEIAGAIVQALRVAMSPSDVADIKRDRPDDVKAYDLYLRGRAKYGFYEPGAMQEALDLFQEAIALDPNYALAWAGVADCMAQFLQHRWTDEADRFRREGLEAARKAVALDPDLAEAHKAEANMLTADPTKIDEAIRSLRRAIRANPRYTPALTNLGVLSVARYDIALSERMYRRAIEVDPQDNFSRIWLSVILYWTFREEEGLACVETVLAAADSEFYVKVGNSMAALLHARLGDLEAAEAAVQAAVDSPLVPYEAIEPMVGWIRALRGRTEEARTILEKINTHPWTTMGFVNAIMQTALTVGDWDEAVRTASYIKDEGWLPMILRLNPEIHSLLEHPDFGPPRCDGILTWPLQAPMIDEARFRLFRKVEIQSGLPEGEDVLGESSIGD